MPRSYRGIVLALGLVLSVASPGGQSSYAQQAQPEQKTGDPIKRIADALDEANKPKREDADCGEGGEDRKSDLCAQWKAADAAEQSADAADWTVTLGWIGVVLGAITMGAAIAAAIFAGNAAIHTRHANQLTNHAQRPWVSVEFHFTQFDISDNFVAVSFNALFTNIGDTVAHDVRARAVAKFAGPEYVEVAAEVFRGWHSQEKYTPTDLMPGESIESWGVTHIAYDRMPWFEGGKCDQINLLAMAMATYRIPTDLRGSPLHITERTFTVAPKDNDPIQQLTIKRDSICDIKPEVLAVRPTIPRRTT